MSSSCRLPDLSTLPMELVGYIKLGKHKVAVSLSSHGLLYLSFDSLVCGK